GQTDRNVHVQCDFVVYSETDLPQTPEAANVIGRPLKISSPISKAGGQRLEAWLRALERRCINDWMVLVIGEDCVGKPRSKVKPVLADRLKVDFCRQKPNRVVVLYDPFKLEHSLVKESWSRLLHELGQLIKSSYQRLIGAYETHIEHLRRECRERKCNYFEFFSYQEELAAVYESLSVFDEALNQYEQLESLFEELVSTFCETGRSMPWLVNFVSLEFSRIDPLGIVNFSDPEKRAHVRAQMANLFEFKLYLFSRNLMQEYERIPVQAVRFLLGTLHQARLL
uniref:Foie-gras_1 domain-containing protein n=1 Tax=Macrostomum lignano TaxID=282301 RepID=A0A1I8GVV3_9PLAT